MRTRFVATSLALALTLTTSPGLLAGQQSQQPPPAALSFRTSVNLVLVDVVVRDRKGAIVTGLTRDDFQLVEDGKTQQILTFAFEQIENNSQPLENASLLAGSAANAAVPRVAAPAAAPAPAATPSAPLTSEDVAGHRLLTLLFDTSSMQPEDVQKATDEATKWVDEKMTAADLVAVATIGSSLQILTDFTSSKEQVRSVLQAFSAADGTAYATVDASTQATDEATASATDDSTTTDVSAQELDTFNNDVRLRALKTLAEALAPIQQKKAILYFSSGMQRNGTDNQIELRAAVNAAVRANVAIYPIDSRGLQAVVPGGSARQGSRGGVAAFNGSAVTNQFTQLAAQQETLTTLAADTGGTAFLDSNDFGEAFGQVTKDISSYYILGYASTNPDKDGRYRRITVRLKNRDVKIEAREGYYADRDFSHTAKGDREVQLQEQLSMQIPA
ncbi:MAG TPA: VWA domain-containing protein, partial [Vicinamibacterales bacterium]|nr:VWA domain-containing protein [Vicinamibacterales bacterium]